MPKSELLTTHAFSLSRRLFGAGAIPAGTVAFRIGNMASPAGNIPNSLYWDDIRHFSGKHVADPQRRPFLRRFASNGASGEIISARLSRQSPYTQSAHGGENW